MGTPLRFHRPRDRSLHHEAEELDPRPDDRLHEQTVRLPRYEPGISSDSRDIEAGNPQRATSARRSLPARSHNQVKKYIGSYAAAMNGLDAVVFTAGMGENNPELREPRLHEHGILRH